MRTAICWAVVVFLLGCEPPGPPGECVPDAGAPDWSIDGMNVEIPWPGSGGVNLYRTPSAIRDHELTYAKNAIPVAPGKLGKRGAMGLAAPVSGATFAIPKSFHTSQFRSMKDFIISFYSQSSSTIFLYAVGLEGGLSDLFINTALNANYVRPAHLSFGEKEYVFIGHPSNVSGYVLNTTPAWSVFTFSDTQTVVPLPKVAARYRSRVVYANLGLGFERHIIFSDDFSPEIIGEDALAANGRNIFVGDDGDRIVGLREVTVTGDRPRPALLVLLEHSAFIITGQPNQSDDEVNPFFGDMEVTRLPYDAGCAAPETIATTPYGTIWAGPDDVWLFRAGQSLMPIGSKIRPVLENTPAPLRYKWTGAYANGFYRLAVFSEGQGPNDDSALGEQWWLDLREGPPSGDPAFAFEAAKWFGPQIFTRTTDTDTAEVGTFVHAARERAGSATELYGLDTGYTNNASTLVITSYDVNANMDTTHDSTLPATETGNTEIEMDVRSKVYQLNPVQQKTFWKGEIVGTPYQESRLTFEAVTDRGRITDTIHRHINPYGLTANIGQLNTDVLEERQQALAFWPDPATRLPGQDVQFRLYDTAGIVVSEGYNDAFTFTDTGASQTFTATLTPGFYTDLTAFLTHLTTQMTAAQDAADPGSYAAWSSTRAPFVVLTSAGTNWRLDFAAGGAVTAAMATKTRAVGAILGYDTSANQSGVNSITAGERVYSKRAARWDLAAMSGMVKVTKRRPE